MERLDILLQANAISEETFNLAHKVISLMKQEHGVSEEQLEMMITHLVMATERVYRGEIVAIMEEDIFSSIRKDENYEIAKDILEWISTISKVEFPQSEQQYMLLHLCNLLKMKSAEILETKEGNL